MNQKKLLKKNLHPQDGEDSWAANGVANEAVSNGAANEAAANVESANGAGKSDDSKDSILLFSLIYFFPNKIWNN